MLKQKEVYEFSSSASTYALTKLILILSVPLPLSIFSVQWFWIWIGLLVIFGIPITIKIFVKYGSVSFLIDDDKLIINQGIISKVSKTILINNIQNISIETGLLMDLFALSTIKIWTSSQSQISSNNNGDYANPDGLLILDSNDSNWLRDYIATKQHK